MCTSLRKLPTRISLTTGVVSILLLTTIVFQAVVGAFFYRQQYTSQYKDLEKLAFQLSDQAARTLAHPLWFVDIVHIGQIVNNFTLIPSVYKISVSDEKGSILYSKILGDGNSRHATIKAAPREIVWVDKVLGQVEIELSTDLVQSHLHYYLVSILVSICILTGVQVLTLFLLLGKTIINPIKAIENYAARINCGTISPPEPSRAIFTKELASLHHSIIAMVTALIDSEKGFRSIYENSLEGIFQTTRDGRFIKANPALVSMLGFHSEEELLTTITDIGRQLFVDADTRREMIKIVLQQGHATRREIGLRHRDGHTIHCLISIYAVHNEQKKINYLEGSLIDISERKHVEEQLATLNRNLETLVAQRTEQLHQHNALLLASEQRYRTLVETVQEGILTVDREGSLDFVNKQMSAMLGWQPQDMLGKDCLDFIDAAWRTSFTSGLQIPKDQPAARFEILFLGADGHGVHTLVSPTPLYDQDDQYSGALAVVTDISALKQLQTQLLHAQKLESIGQLAAGIAHEINTPTQYVGNNIGFLRDAFEEILEMLTAYEKFFQATQKGEALAGPLQNIEESRERLQIESLFSEIPAAFHDTLEGIARITKIVGSVKAFAHPGQDQNAAADLNEAIRSTIIVSTNEWKYVADVTTDLDPTLPFVPCNISAINQVIVNLLVNAAHAIADVTENGRSGKGRIIVTTKHVNDYAEIRISDSGSGIAENIRNQIFDPFFTTKEVGKGTGQGLAIAHTIITETHLGSITFETEPGRGTTFIILLPLAAYCLIKTGS